LGIWEKTFKEWVKAIMMAQPKDVFQLIGIKLHDKTSTPKKRRSCPKTVKETVWRKYFGNRMTGKCWVCKKSITFTDFEVGHNKPFSNRNSAKS